MADDVDAAALAEAEATTRSVRLAWDLSAPPGVWRVFALATDLESGSELPIMQFTWPQVDGESAEEAAESLQSICLLIGSANLFGMADVAETASGAAITRSTTPAEG